MNFDSAISQDIVECADSLSRIPDVTSALKMYTRLETWVSGCAPFLDYGLLLLVQSAMMRAGRGIESRLEQTSLNIAIADCLMALNPKAAQMALVRN